METNQRAYSNSMSSIRSWELDEEDDYLEKLIEPTKKPMDLVEFELKVSCLNSAACLSSIERLMHTEFDDKGMVSITTVLQTQMMMVQFEASTTKEVTA